MTAPTADSIDGIGDRFSLGVICWISQIAATMIGSFTSTGQGKIAERKARGVSRASKCDDSEENRRLRKSGFFWTRMRYSAGRFSYEENHTDGCNSGRIREQVKDVIL